MNMGLSLPLSINVQNTIEEGERKINGSVKPFTRAEYHFTDARFFEEDDTPKETMPIAITSTGKGTIKNIFQVLKEHMPAHRL